MENVNVKRTKADKISSLVIGYLSIIGGLALLAMILSGVKNPILYSVAIILMFTNFGYVNFKFWTRVIAIALIGSGYVYLTKLSNQILVDSVNMAIIVAFVLTGIRQTIRCSYRSEEMHGEGEGIWNWHVFHVIAFWFVFGVAIAVMKGFGIWWLWIVLSLLAYAAATFFIWLRAESYRAIVWLALIQSAIFIGLSAIGVYAF